MRHCSTPARATSNPHPERAHAAAARPSSPRPPGQPAPTPPRERGRGHPAYGGRGGEPKAGAVCVAKPPLSSAWCAFVPLEPYAYLVPLRSPVFLPRVPLIPVSPYASLLPPSLYLRLLMPSPAGVLRPYTPLPLYPVYPLWGFRRLLVFFALARHPPPTGFSGVRLLTSSPRGRMMPTWPKGMLCP